MRAELRDVDGELVGTVSLVGTAAAVEDAEPGMAEFLDRLVVVLPGVGPVALEHGEHYLRALPATLRGPYLSATFVASSPSGG
jgi:hypothetical protein